MLAMSGQDSHLRVKHVSSGKAGKSRSSRNKSREMHLVRETRKIDLLFLKYQSPLGCSEATTSLYIHGSSRTLLNRKYPAKLVKYCHLAAITRFSNPRASSSTLQGQQRRIKSRTVAMLHSVETSTRSQPSLVAKPLVSDMPTYKLGVLKPIERQLAASNKHFDRLILSRGCQRGMELSLERATPV